MQRSAIYIQHVHQRSTIFTGGNGHHTVAGYTGHHTVASHNAAGYTEHHTVAGHNAAGYTGHHTVAGHNTAGYTGHHTVALGHHITLAIRQIAAQRCKKNYEEKRMPQLT